MNITNAESGYFFLAFVCLLYCGMYFMFHAYHLWWKVREFRSNDSYSKRQETELFLLLIVDEIVVIVSAVTLYFLIV